MVTISKTKADQHSCAKSNAPSELYAVRFTPGSVVSTYTTPTIINNSITEAVPPAKALQR